MKTFVLIAVVILVLTLCETEKNPPKVIICSDINNVGGDPDDKQSMAHLLMYANEVDIVSIIPDYWNGRGVEATMQTIIAYEKDFLNPEFNFQKFNYPSPNKIRGLVQTNKKAAIESIINQAKKSSEPIHILIWGGMTTLSDALQKAPDIINNIRIYTIGTHRMAENMDAEINSNDTLRYGIRKNWNHWGRDDIFNDSRFDNLWWLENDWAYNGMFEGEEPAQLLLEIKDFGALGFNIWQVVQSKNWAHYFRAGDTPSLLYLLEPGANIDNPRESTWAGKFVKPYSKTRPNYWIDDAGLKDWDYANPENTWQNAKLVYKNRVNNLYKSRNEMYDSYRQKMKELYNK